MYAGAWGYRTDGDAGLMHVGARHYDAQVGRFVTRDTVLSEHPYLYCEHDPANWVDPSGHAGWFQWFGKLVDLASVFGLGYIGPPPPPEWNDIPMVARAVPRVRDIGRVGPWPPKHLSWHGVRITFGRGWSTMPGTGIAAGGVGATLVVGAATGYVGARIVGGYADRLRSFMDPDGDWGTG